MDPGNISLRSKLEEFAKEFEIDMDVLEDYFDSMQRHEDTADVHINLAKKLRGNPDFEDFVIEEYQKAITLDTTLGFPHCEIGMILYIKNKEGEALKEINIGIKKDPKNPEFGDYYYTFALLLLKTNKTDKDLKFFYKAIELESFEINNYEGEILSILLEKRFIGKAEEFFKKAIAFFLKLSRSKNKKHDFSWSYCYAHCALGELFEKTGRFEEAISEYQIAAGIAGDNSRPHRLLADLLLKQNRLNEEISEYHKAIEIYSKFAPDHKKFADALIQNGQFLEALSGYRELMRLDPDNKEYSDAWLNLKTILIERDALERIKESKPIYHTFLSDDHYQSLEDEFQRIIAKAENEHVEFKTSAFWSINYSKEDIENSQERDIKKFGKEVSKIVLIKTIAGFLNTNGGNVVIGIQENKDGNLNDIIGIESEFSKLKDPCIDGYGRMITDEILKKYLPNEIFHHLSDYIKSEFPKIYNKTICWIKIKKSKEPVFLAIQNDDYFLSGSMQQPAVLQEKRPQIIVLNIPGKNKKLSHDFISQRRFLDYTQPNFHSNNSCSTSGNVSFTYHRSGSCLALYLISKDGFSLSALSKRIKPIPRIKQSDSILDISYSFELFGITR